MASTVIAASLITDLNSDLPGTVIAQAQVTTPVYPPWRDNDVEYFIKNASKIYTDVVHMALYTRQRRSDLIKMKWSDVDDRGFIHVVQQKTSKHVWVAIHPNLKAIMHQIDKNGEYILTNASNQPWTAEALKSGMRRVLNSKVMKPLKEKNLTLH